jgi:hypothetical protein
VIRFSAALVAVAIGVLIGGIATSKLLLVYIAIVVSAAALVALAIGVVLKREELFGEVQGLAPAAAGPGPALQARAGESAGESQHKVPAGAHVAPPPPFQGAAGGYAAAFGGTAQSASSASSSAGAGSSAARTAAAGQGRQADPVPPWETSAARGPWASSTPDWMHSGQDERTAGAPSGAGGRAPSAWQDTTPAGTPGGRGGGWGVPDADTQPAEKAPRSWAAPSSPPAPADAPPVKPAAGQGAAAPSWFDRLGGQAGAPPTVAAPTVASPAVPEAAGSADAASGDAGAGDEDDWPTRYSWLEDTGEGGEAAETVATPVAGAEPEGKSPVPAGTAADAEPEEVAAGTAADSGASAAETVAAPTQDARGTDAVDGSEADPANANAAGESGADIIAFPGPGQPELASDADAHDPHDEREGEPVADDAGEAGPAVATSETGSEPPATAEGDAAPGSDLVTVVPGVPRYHRTDCVLIRFMPEGDVQKQSVAAARDAGCTPCAACQPEG